MDAFPRPVIGFVQMDHFEFQMDEKNPALSICTDMVSPGGFLLFDSILVF